MKGRYWKVGQPNVFQLCGRELRVPKVPENLMHALHTPTTYPVVGGGFHIVDNALVFQRLDEWKKLTALQSMLVETIGRTIACCQHNPTYKGML